ncbi:hypothetical protein [Paraburkholderia tropica]|uniref:hypothetical protein n=1 Tax=Paraburkholderia tropica TaxID=92647 RepID=UPI001F2027A8|nr:hypothetical protein [Paraburkholderia tropica]
MAQKAIGPSFYDELKTASLAGLPFSWSPDGTLTYDASLTEAQISAIETVYADHDPTKPSWSAFQVEAQSALDKSDITVSRCYENAVELPAAWVAYRKALRAIVGAASGDATQSLPTQPAYPAGT